MPILDVDTSQMGEAELRAHYHNTAPLADVQFWIKNARMSDPLRAGFLALESSILNLHLPRAAVYQQLTLLQAAWRKESNAREALERRAARLLGTLAFPIPIVDTVECPAVFDHSESEVA